MCHRLNDEARYYQQLSEGALVGNPHPDSDFDGEAAERLHDFLRPVPNDVRLPEQMTSNSH
jgi:hypothetical protein